MAECGCCGPECIQRLCMEKVPIFSQLTRGELLQIAPRIGHLAYKKGGRLFSEGETPGTLFILNEGGAKAFHYTPDGREQILYVFAEGDFFGEQYLLGGRKAAYSVEALEEVRVCTLTRQDFHDIIRAFPGIAVKIMEELEERMARLEGALQDMGVRSVDARIGSLLLDFARRYGSDAPEGILIHLPLSREGMANYLGIARETMSRKLGQLENDGAIRAVGNKGILILDREALQNVAGKI